MSLLHSVSPNSRLRDTRRVGAIRETWGGVNINNQWYGGNRSNYFGISRDSGRRDRLDWNDGLIVTEI